MMNISDFVFYIILPLGVVGYLFLKKKFSYFEENGIPHIKPSWIFGNMDGIGRKFHMSDFILRLYQECKGKDVIAGFYTFVLIEFHFKKLLFRCIWIVYNTLLLRSSFGCSIICKQNFSDSSHHQSSSLIWRQANFLIF